MTVVRTTPPPRLPVRDKAAAQDRGWGGVSPMLTRLAAERATGILVRERGTLHLAEGQVVHAESPAAPALDVLLTTRGPVGATAAPTTVPAADLPPGATITGPRREAAGRHRSGRVPVGGGRPAPGALELCHLVALYDAAYFALAPSSTPGRFRYGTTQTPGAVRPVPVAALERETLRRRDLLHRIWPDSTTDATPLVRAEAVAAPALTPRRQAVLALVDGVRTASDIARELGRPAFHTLVDVRRLVAAGVVAPRPQAPAVPPPTVLGTPGEPGDPDITLLKRLRDALEAL
ncbi:transcriptional regulator [Streptomyces sp. NPDC005574]|uniref:transcriptional regulator n=1 Tax=Streptomyces sp. NPDC005574 TaxID=3156891 RepID=UPI0033BDBEB2